MTIQSEATLEKNLITQLDGLGYGYVEIKNEASLLANLKDQLEMLNHIEFTTREFEVVLNHLSKGNIFQKAGTLREKFVLKRDDESIHYLYFFDSEIPENNLCQVTNQVTMEGAYTNRYDVTILVNGLPLVQLELKRRGLELKEAFNQINRYQRHSFWANTSLFQYVQLFVISNGVNTKYYSNNREQSFKQTFYWADKENKNITDLTDFTNAFLNTDHLSEMIAHYIVLNETLKILMVLRPYQYYATKAIIDKVKTSDENGYIWHTTGSGKTLTSFKASQIIMGLDEVSKVVFVVDRKDLDTQTMNEFNAFKKDSVNGTANTNSLVKQFADNTKLIVTTIQKLNNAIQKDRYKAEMNNSANERIVFIFDECHRSQFGDTHDKITKFFKNYQMFGFTGTPIFADTAQKNKLGKRTTKDLFGECLHRYLITDAIGDQNVLRFNVEYLGRYKQKESSTLDIDVEAIDTKEVIESPERLEKIADHIIKHHDQKTRNREYSAMFAVSSIDTLITYYDMFKKKKEAGEHDLRIATIFTFAANEGDRDATGIQIDDLDANDPKPTTTTRHSREKLDEYISDYNQMYGTSYSTRDADSFENFFKDIGSRMKNREKSSFNDKKDRLDILLVVNMFLTGFDAKKLNTLYVDKNLKDHGLIQAFSRTNRILGEEKSQGNILCYRNLKDATDDAIALFSNKDAKEVVLLPPYEDVLSRFQEAFNNLKTIAPTLDSINDLPDEEHKLAFVQAFRELIRSRNVLTSFTDFDWDDIDMTEQQFEDYKSKYYDLHEEVKAKSKEKTSILQDVDFELELIHRDEINVTYILKLLAKLKGAEEKEATEQKQSILNLLAGDLELRSKRELIEKFIEENLPQIADPEDITEEFSKFWETERSNAFNRIVEEESLEYESFKEVVDRYLYSSKTPLKDEIRSCMKEKPTLLQMRKKGPEIISKIQEYTKVFMRGMFG